MPFVPSPPDAKDVCLVDENYRNKFYPQSSTTTQPKKSSKTAKVRTSTMSDILVGGALEQGLFLVLLLPSKP